MTENVEEIAKRVAKETIEQHYALLGYDITDPEERRALQADFAYIRRGRAGSEEAARIFKRSAITVALGGLLWMLWEGFKIAVKAKGGG